MKFRPTKEQEQAIFKDGSLLVSAAAGSGKTAVLVERVIRLLTDESKPVMANRLLIVTFTNLAAAELRSRLEKRLNEEIENCPNSALLQKQKILLSSAQICTIDSFCIDFIKENFELSNINPSFKIADRSTLNFLKKAVLSQIFNEYFNNEDKEFSALLELVGTDYDDTVLAEYVTEIFDYSRQMPYPALWLKNTAENYRAHFEGENSHWFDETLKTVKGIAKTSLSLMNNAIAYIETNEKAYAAYSANYFYIRDFFFNLTCLCEKGKWDEVYNAVNFLYEPPKLSALKTADKTANVEIAAGLRSDATDNIKELKKLIYADSVTVKSEIAVVYPHIVKLVELINLFEERLYSELYKRNMMTFYMCEQQALEMLTEVKDGLIVKKAEADEYISRYDAVLVDEYQDTNDLQDRLFSVISDDSKKLFCVGDIKQSIYRFRGANPYNFLSKKELMKESKVDLGCNFRSRKEICNFINAFFKNLMYKENSGFDYDEREELVAKAEFPETVENKTEVHIADLEKIGAHIDFGKNVRENALIAEANIIADVIIDNMNKPAFIKQDDKTLRRAKYSDFAILVRALSLCGPVFASVLKSRGIPVSVDFGGLLDSDEVKTLIALLRIINNPRDDISLLTVLTSPIFAFKLEEIANIRLNNKKDRFISALLLAAQNGNMKVRSFLDTLSDLRNRKLMLDIAGLIEEIFEKTNLLNIVSRQAEGAARRGNLLAFQSFAKEFDSKNSRLASFLQTVDMLREEDFKKPPHFSDDAVKIMTVHTSKGLQFPICILANTAHQFNMQDLNDSLLLDERIGFCFKFNHEKLVAKDNNLLRSLLRSNAKKQLLAEELRLLYVALTRAEDKLIITAAVDNLPEYASRVAKKVTDVPNFDNVDISVFSSSKSYLEWLLSHFVHSSDPEILFNSSKDDVYDDKLCVYIHNNLSIGEKQELKPQETEALLSTDKIVKAYNFVYPYSPLRELEAKSSVTALVHKADVKKYAFTSRPAFMQAKGLSGAEKGTATHKFMQYCDFDNVKADLEGEIFRLYDYGFLTEPESEAIDKEAVRVFFDSELFARIKSAKLCKREERFLTEFSACEIDSSLDKAFAGEMIVVQGSVDLLFEEEDGIVILDFKTDKNKDEAELKAAYAEQLKIYAKACSKIFLKPIKQLLIYSFALGKEIECEG